MDRPPETTNPALKASPDDFPPSACDDLADELERAIERFRRWDLPIRPLSRLQRAVAILRRVARDGTFGTDARRLVTVVNAIMVAGDFIQVSYCLGDVRVERIAEELTRSFKGTLDEQDAQFPYDYQAQLWLGALLARAELRTRVPPALTDRAHPDFAITVDSANYGVEVKRPQPVAAANALISRAADQIWDYGRPGIIALDVSLCLNVREFVLTLVNANQAGSAYLSDRFLETTRQLALRVREGEGEKYRLIKALVVYCRFPYWLNCEGKLIPRFAWMFATPIFDPTAHSVRLRLMGALQQWLGEPAYASPAAVAG
jgi:hypothetical protein